MEFDVLYVSPFYESGPSGHPFSIRDHRRLAERYRPESSNLDDGELIAGFVAEARGQGLRVMVDAVLTHTASDATLLSNHPEWFMRGPLGQEERFAGPSADDTARLDWYGQHSDAIGKYFRDLVLHYTSLGIEGFRCPSAVMISPEVWLRLIAEAKAAAPESFFCAEALGRQDHELRQLQGLGFDYIFDSVQWWDARSPWFIPHQSLLRSIAPTIGFPESEGTGRFWEDHGGGVRDRDRRILEYKNRYLLAAAFSNGLLMPAGYEAVGDWALAPGTLAALESGDASNEIARFITATNRLKASLPALNGDGPIRALAHPDEAIQGFSRRSETPGDLAFILVNTDPVHSYRIDLDWILTSLDEIVDLEDVTPDADIAKLDIPSLVVGPSEIKILHAHAFLDIRDSEPEPVALAWPGTEPPSRVVIEAVAPEIDGGSFPVHAIIGDRLIVSADIYRDGHDAIAAGIRLQEEGAPFWRLAPMRFVDNDRWSGSIALTRQGRFRYTVEAWTDKFASWRRDALKKRAAGQPLAPEIPEARALIEEAAARAAQASLGRIESRLQTALATIDGLDRADSDTDTVVGVLLSEFLAHAMAAVPDKGDRAVKQPMLEGIADRVQARFSSWYEIFPRSQTVDASRPGTFADCIRRLPEIHELGFDVLYLVPIHPIGKTNRKGRNNSLSAAADDPGSPYAIGSAAGGHDAIEPALGTIEDFRRFRREAQAHGLELALDLAVQCAPDHPWITEHPTWFRRRADGTIKFAENPPKKYEDIVNVDFENPEWFAIWNALLDIVRFWVAEGVKIFRVDNPHTKPVPFWQWLIAEVKREAPEVIFLAEAFTRPKMMRRLAKIGFAQSYSYFTWRNTKAELTEYLVELTTGPSRDYMQPNFFANTPDILPLFLQQNGRAGFQIRLVLAATLSPAYGIYSGFELCEAEALPGREEYANSEKYEIRVWDWDRPGNIKHDVARLNRLRRESPALQEFVNLRMLESTDPSVLFYGKRASVGKDQIFVVVNLDAQAPASSWLKFPLETMGLGDDGVFETFELFSGERRQWRGRYHEVHLDPASHPAMVLRVITAGVVPW